LFVGAKSFVLWCCAGFLSRLFGLLLVYVEGSEPESLPQSYKVSHALWNYL